MCAPDPNQGRRDAARIENNKRIAKYGADSIKQWNREVDVDDKVKNIRGMGMSRARSDFDEYALQLQGKGLKTKETAAKNYFQKAFVNEGGRSNRAGRNRRVQYLNNVAKVDQEMFKLATSGEAKAMTGIQRRNEAMIQGQIDSLGEGPQFGMPTMMPPKDRAGQLMNSISFGMNVASGIMSFTGSDEKLKYDITKVGVSPKGYNIYEWRYKANNQKWRGVIAQDVVKQNPMAVGIMPSGFLGVNYDKLDVKLEKVNE